MSCRRRLLAALAIALSSTAVPTVVAGAPDDPPTTSVAPVATTPPVVEELRAEAATVTPEQAADWLAGYTRGRTEAARGLPMRIGFATDEVGFPGWQAGVEAAVHYLNTELGGIRGRPVELVSCPVRLAAEAGACAGAFATDPTLEVVLTGAFTFGGTRFLNRLAGNHAVLIGAGVTVGDLTSPSAVSFSPGTSGLAAGAVHFAVTDLAARSVAVVVSDDEQGETAAQVIQPLLATDIAAAIVYVPTDADTTAATAALHTAGALHADATVLIVPPSTCQAVHDAAAALDPSAQVQVITTDSCIDVAGARPGWYGVGSGFSPQLADLDSGMAAALHVWRATSATANSTTTGDSAAGDGTADDAIADDGDRQPAMLTSSPVDEPSDVESPTTPAAPLPTEANVMAIATMLTTARLLNELGDDSDPDVVSGALRSFGGTVMAQPGPTMCGLPPYVAVCIHAVGVGRITASGSWEPVRSPLLDNPINVEPL